MIIREKSRVDPFPEFLYIFIHLHSIHFILLISSSVQPHKGYLFLSFYIVVRECAFYSLIRDSKCFCNVSESLYFL